MKNLVERKKICDGLLEDCIEKSLKIRLDNEEINIDLKKFAKHELGAIDDSTKKIILGRIVHKKSKMFGTIQNEEGLPIYAEIITSQINPTKYLVLCAFGETQPARYQAFLEGVFVYPITND